MSNNDEYKEQNLQSPTTSIEVGLREGGAIMFIELSKSFLMVTRNILPKYSPIFAPLPVLNSKA